MGPGMNGELRSSSPTVGVFRLDLFKHSETFIAAQAARYVRYDPLFIGRGRLGEAPAGARLAVLASGAERVRAVGLGDPAPFLKALGGVRPALIHAHFAIDGAFAVPLAQSLGAPLVTTLHGFDVTTRDLEIVKGARPAPLLALARRGRLQRQGALFLCVSDFIRRAALAKGFPAERTVVAPLGIDLERRQPFGVSTPGLIVHVGRMVEKKGTLYLIRAFARMAPKAPAARLVIVGDGPLRGSLEAEAASLGLGERIVFTGGLDHATTLDWMSRASVVAVPSVTAANGDSEGLPTVVFEAGALARAVVATRNSGIPEAVDDGETGLLAPERDVEALAAALERLTGDPEMAARFGQAGRQLMLQRYDAAKLTAALEARYDALLAGEAVSAA